MIIDAVSLAAYVVTMDHPVKRAALNAYPPPDSSLLPERGETEFVCRCCHMVFDYPSAEPIMHAKGCAYLAALRILKMAS